MDRKRWIQCLAVLLNLGVLAYAPISQGQESAPNGGPGQGEIIFSPGAAVRPPEGRHQVQTEQQINICLKLNAEEFPFFSQLKEGLLGYRIILEDSAEPPHVLILNPGTRLKRMVAAPDGCYAGIASIPRYLPSGVYQVADLLLARDDQSYYSVRETLYSFSQVDELEISNPNSDLQPPQLIRIEDVPHNGVKVKISQRQLRIKARQIFLFKDDGVGLDGKTLKVSYAIKVDGNVTSYARAQCKSTRRPHDRYYCKLNLVRPLEEWGPRSVVLELDSISIRDMAGNKLNLTEPASWETQATGALTSFEFPPQSRKTKNQVFQLRNQSLY